MVKPHSLADLGRVVEVKAQNSRRQSERAVTHQLNPIHAIAFQVQCFWVLPTITVSEETRVRPQA